MTNNGKNEKRDLFAQPNANKEKGAMSMEYGMINNMGGLEEELIKSAKAIDELAKTTYQAIKRHNPRIGEEELAACIFMEGLRSAVLAETLKSLIDKWAIIEREVGRIAGRNANDGK